MSYAVGVDVGGTYIKSALVLDKKILRFSKTETGKNKKQIVENILSSILKVVDKEKIRKIGIGVPSVIDKNKKIISSTNLSFAGIDLRKIVWDRLKIPTFIENDVNCFALGEALFGAGKNYETVVGITLGTGVGGGTVTRKRVYSGKASAGELGHVVVCYNGRKCNCNNKGCLEAYSSGSAIVREARRAGLKIKNPLEIYKLALKENKTAKRIFKDMGSFLGIGLTSIIHVLDPDIIVIGGEVSNSWRFFEKSMLAEIRKRSLFPVPRIVRSRLINSAVLGASAL